jgi:hypothetical protein
MSIVPTLLEESNPVVKTIYISRKKTVGDLKTTVLPII